MCPRTRLHPALFDHARRIPPRAAEFLRPRHPRLDSPAPPLFIESDRTRMNPATRACVLLQTRPPSLARRAVFTETPPVAPIGATHGPPLGSKARHLCWRRPPAPRAVRNRAGCARREMFRAAVRMRGRQANSSRACAESRLSCHRAQRASRRCARTDRLSVRKPHDSVGVYLPLPRAVSNRAGPARREVPSGGGAHVKALEPSNRGTTVPSRVEVASRASETQVSAI
ncbi:hypothetical protein B0H10DRAFT_661082 [Mycena sp. CBHHK59/15]|nr:hypothetical protein B0H10DRAFT_661082 [Mycena sp. CBHHK59/15]